MFRPDDYIPYIKSLAVFMADEGYTLRPLPKFLLKNNRQDGVFIPTGYYSPDERKVVAYINGRHPKDVLRSIAHELIHHRQNLEGRLGKGAYSGTKIIDDDRLKPLEEEAYKDGNIGFRLWTENEQRKKNK